jgi:teichuronic acid biosynthesis glycosyltransferase TuaH
MQNQNIIMVCQQNWDLGLGTNAKNLAKEFAKNNRVLYVNMPLDINTLLRNFNTPEVKKKIRILRRQQEGLTKVEDNIWVYTPNFLSLSINWLSWQNLFVKLNRFNGQLLAQSIQKAVKSLHFSSYYLLQDGLLFQGLELKRLLQPIKFIYYLRDYMITMPYFQRHGRWIEESLLKQADVVATNSAYLADYALQYNSSSYDIGQGCVLSLYQAEADYPLPDELATIAPPRIGYTGFLTNLRLDLDLLEDIARQRPDWNLVLVGPEDEAFRQSELHTMPNVHFIGSKTPAQLPAYLKHFDVCINPQVVNEITMGNYPLKIDEYLAMGKQVVATYTKTMEMFENYTYLCHTKKGWIEAIEKAITYQKPHSKDERIKFAQSHTWKSSTQKLYTALANS